MYGILAYYQDKTINLSNTDPHFDKLFEKLTHVYRLESSSSAIVTDKETKKLLENASAFSEPFYHELLSDYSRINTPMIVPKAYSHVYLLPIVKYILNSIYVDTSDTLIFPEADKFWFGKGLIDATRNGQSLHFPCRILSPSPDFHEITLLNVLTTGNTLNINISFNRRNIALSFSDRYFGYEGYMNYEISEERAAFIHTLSQKDSVIFHREMEYQPVKKAPPVNRILKLTRTKDIDWSAYELPWNGYIHLASADGCQYRVTVYESKNIRISQCFCYKNLKTAEADLTDLCIYSLNLYERDDLTELHMLKAAPPVSGTYAADYAGTFFKASNTPFYKTGD